jgi:hypothetical protein
VSPGLGGRTVGSFDTEAVGALAWLVAQAATRRSDNASQLILFIFFFPTMLASSAVDSFYLNPNLNGVPDAKESLE